MGRLEGSAAMITGACGGLGRALSRRFAAEGAGLFLTDMDEAGLCQWMEELDAEGAVVHGAAADLRNSSSITNLARSACEAMPDLDILVNNAGVSETKPLWEITESDWDKMLAVNVKAPFFLLQRLGRHMAAHGGGSIINIASVAGRGGRPMLLHYAATKAAVISITRSAALALASYQVRVNAIAPGMMDTEMLHTLQEDWKLHAPEQSVPSSSAIPIGRVAQPEDVVGAAVFLASRESVYVTGQTLNVCGGLVLS